MKERKIKKREDFLNEKESWGKIFFGKTIKEVFNDIYSEINPVLKWKKMEKYHKELKESVEKGQKELEERKKALQELEDKLKNREKELEKKRKTFISRN